jgi:hypothetical protein
LTLSLARDDRKRAALRARLTANHARLFDMRTRVRDLERAFQRMHNQAGAPQAFAVEG